MTPGSDFQLFNYLVVVTAKQPCAINVFSENGFLPLNYSSEKLRSYWPSSFTVHFQPDKSSLKQDENLPPPLHPKAMALIKAAIRGSGAAVGVSASGAPATRLH